MDLAALRDYLGAKPGAMEDLPFGGVGPSGMGAYHGRAGFDTLSLRSIVEFIAQPSS